MQNLPGFIFQKKNSGSFFIELVLDKTQLSFRAEVSFLIQIFFISTWFFYLQSIRNYLIKLHPDENIFDEVKLLGVLSKKNEKFVTDGLYSYIVDTFPKVSVNDVTDCCNAVVQLFPYINKESDGIVRIGILLFECSEISFLVVYFLFDFV